MRRVIFPILCSAFASCERLEEMFAQGPATPTTTPAIVRAYWNWDKFVRQDTLELTRVYGTFVRERQVVIAPPMTSGRLQFLVDIPSLEQGIYLDQGTIYAELEDIDYSLTADIRSLRTELTNLQHSAQDLTLNEGGFELAERIENLNTAKEQWTQALVLLDDPALLQLLLPDLPAELSRDDITQELTRLDTQIAYAKQQYAARLELEGERQSLEVRLQELENQASASQEQQQRERAQMSMPFDGVLRLSDQAGLPNTEGFIRLHPALETLAFAEDNSHLYIEARIDNPQWTQHPVEKLFAEIDLGTKNIHCQCVGRAQSQNNEPLYRFQIPAEHQEMIHEMLGSYIEFSLQLQLEQDAYIVPFAALALEAPEYTALGWKTLIEQHFPSHQYIAESDSKVAIIPAP